MTDNEIKREQPSFEVRAESLKKRTKEFFSTYENPNGSEDGLEICLIREGYRAVLMAEKEINRQKAETENLKDILYDADGVNLVNYWHQQCKIAENGCRNFEEENENLKAEIERLKTHLEELADEVEDKMTYMCGCKNCIETVKRIIKDDVKPFDMYCDSCNHCKHREIEAVKEFAARLRYVSKLSQSDAFSDRLVTVRDIDDLEKEFIDSLKNIKEKNT